MRAQITLEFLVILLIVLTYLGFVFGLWKSVFDSLDQGAQRFAVGRVADELEFYTKLYSNTQGNRTIKVSLFPTTKMDVDYSGGTFTVRTCSTTTDFGLERTIPGALTETTVTNCSYKYSGFTSFLLVKKGSFSIE